MKKKFLAVVMAATMCLSMGMTAFAAESTEGSKPDAKPEETVETIVKEDQVAATVNGKEVAVEIKAVEKAVQEAVEKEDFVANVIEANLTTNPDVAKKLQDADEVVILGSVDINVELKEGEEAKIVIDKMDGIKAGDSVYALHQKEDGSWEIIDVEVLEDGSLVLKMSSCSPVVFVKTASVDVPDDDKKPEQKPADTKKPADDTKKPADDTKKPADTKKPVTTEPGKSPKTGDR